MTEIDQQIAAAKAAQRSGKASEAWRMLEKVLVEAPSNPAVLNSLGVLALDLGDAQRAADLHRRATDADPAAPVLWLNLARAQRQLSDNEGERVSLTRALAIDGLFFMALLRKAELHQRLGETGLANSTWQGALATAPQDPPPALAAVLAEGAAFVAEQTQVFSREIDEGLSAARYEASGDLRRFDAAMGHASGRRKIYTNECAGTHFPFLPADEFFDRKLFPWLADLESQTDAIRDELLDLLETGAPGFAPYVQIAPGAPENKWTPLDASMAWSSYYLWKYGAALADAHERCPKTVRALKALPLINLPSRSPSAFFSLLEPGAHIPAHTGVTNVRAIIHLPLIIPEGCRFRVGGETRTWKVGQAIAFDDTIEHEAWNDSKELRAILIFDVWNPHLTETERDLLQRYFDIADKSALNPGMLDGT